MIRHVVYMVEDDTNPPLDFDIKNDDEVRDPDTGEVLTEATPFDLTDYTVYFIIKAPDGTVVNTGHQVCTTLDAVLGQARYQFQSGDTATPGRHQCDVRVVDGGGGTQTEYTVTDLMIREKNG